MDIGLRMPFFILSNIEIDFDGRHFVCNMFTTTKAVLISTEVKLIGKKEFGAIAFHLKDKAFVVHIVSISRNSDINLSGRVLLASLKANKAPI